MTHAGKIVLAAGVILVGSMAMVYGRGGFGGGGGGRGGGGFSGGGGGSGFSGGGGGGFQGGSRPGGSSPSFSKPSGGNTGGGVRPSGGAAGGNRPSVGGGAGSNRPSAGGGGLQPGTRPAIGTGGQVANRPGAGLGQGGTGRPNAGQGIGNRPGAAQLPASLPGLGGRVGNPGAARGDRALNRPQTLEARQGDLQNRMTNGREDWQSHRQDMQGDRQAWRDQHREDWQNWADGNIHNHGDWYHDSWHGDWYPGAGWSHMWENYPVAAALGVTRWGINRLAYGFGYWDYANPYGGGGGGGEYYDYSQPLDTMTEPAAESADPAAPADPGMQAFADARVAFYENDYAKALTLLDTTLKTMPNDAVVHEFRALVLFAQGKFPEGASAIYAVLSAGPGWDWTTMRSLYPSLETYTNQLRVLEKFTIDQPKSADGAFLLGYHYLTLGHAKEANKEFKRAKTVLPTDRLVAQLVEMTTPPDAAASPATTKPAEVPKVPPEKVLKLEKMIGNWQAISQGAVYQLNLSKDGRFTWSFERGKEHQSIKGVFAVDQNTIAMEPDSGGTMVAEVEFIAEGIFRFKMIGGDAKDPGLQFKAAGEQK